MTALCKAVGAEQRQEAAQKAAELLRTKQWYQHAADVFSYASLPDEADTAPVNQAVLRDGKRLALPRLIRGAEAEMEFRFVDENTRLVPSAFNFLEPPADAGSAPFITGNLLVIVPGRAFTKNGTRLGRGKGFYDRWLSRIQAAFLLSDYSLTLAGYCYDFQIIRDIPQERHDIMMDYILTA
ncbi:MAG: 5-formyltetrahydrofolate cyclo-ligase [Treponemataceae bacterium]|nr:MAG: 5-formyltetrahydrofolate cyclo-ligase [Treponemataceae bacterium]